MLWAVRSFDDLSKRELYEVLKLRSDVFVVEQGSPYADVDGLDDQSWHLLGRKHGELVAYARWYEAESRVWLGRIVLHSTHRGGGRGRVLISRALEAIGSREVWIRAQLALSDYYQTLGWSAAGPVYDDHGVDHQVMRRPPAD